MYKFVSSTNENHHSLNVNDTCKCAYDTRNEIWQSRIRAARLNTIHFLLFRHEWFFFRFWSKHPNTNLLTFLNYFQRHLLNHLGKIISFTTKFWCFLEECFLFPQYATFSSVCSNIVVFMRYFGPYFSYFFKIIFFYRRGGHLVDLVILDALIGHWH